MKKLSLLEISDLEKLFSTSEVIAGYKMDSGKYCLLLANEVSFIFEIFYLSGDTISHIPYHIIDNNSGNYIEEEVLSEFDNFVSDMEVIEELNFKISSIKNKKCEIISKYNNKKIINSEIEYIIKSH